MTEEQEFETVTRDEAQTAMTDLIAESIAAPNMETENPAEFRLLQDKIRRHARIVCERDEASASADLQERLGEDANLSPADCVARAKELMRTPGYITEEPGVLSEAERAKLRVRIHALYQAAEKSPPDAGEAAEELRRLAVLGVEEADDFDLTGIQPWEIRGLRAQRLLVEGDHASLTPVLEAMLQDVEATPASIDMFRQFASSDIDPDLRGRIARTLVEWIYAAHG